MSYLTIIWSMFGATGIAVGLLQLQIWLHDRTRMVHLFAAVMTVAAGVQAMVELATMMADSATDLPPLLIAGNYVIAVVLVVARRRDQRA